MISGRSGISLVAPDKPIECLAVVSLQRRKQLAGAGLRKPFEGGRSSAAHGTRQGIADLTAIGREIEAAERECILITQNKIVRRHLERGRKIVGVTAVVLWLLPRFAPWFFTKVGHRVSEPETKFISLILLALGGLASIAGSEAVLPAYLVGMALAPVFLSDQELPHRMRIVAGQHDGG